MLHIQPYDLKSDSLVIGIQKALKHIGVEYPSWLISGVFGIGARFTLAMNVKSGREIGHPSSNYIWDIISTTEYCFPELALNWELYINKAYDNRARTTAAQQNENLSKAVKFVETLDQIEGDLPLIYADPSGEWVYSENTSFLADISYEQMPFGVVAFRINRINSIENPYHFPISTLVYLIKTLERGEEPMEIEGLGSYSAVSGWKAFARWMQAHSMPLKGIQHEYLINVIRLLAIRRKENSKYWLELANRLDNKIEREFANDLYLVYSKVAEKIENLLSDNTFNYQDIKKIYYTEQETLPLYKQIKSYLKY